LREMKKLSIGSGELATWRGEGGEPEGKGKEKKKTKIFAVLK